MKSQPWAALALALLAFSPMRARAQADTVPAAERERVADGLDRLIRARFAHWEGVPGLRYDTAFRSYRARAGALPDRFDFDTATLAFVAGLRNGHTDFWDRWLSERHGAPLPFTIRPVQGRWIVVASEHPELRAGDEVAAIDGEPFERFFARRERYLSGSSERWRRRALTRHPYLFPAHFGLKLADGREVRVVRARPAATPAAASTEAVPNRWLAPDSVAYLRLPYFGEERYEARALQLLGSTYRGARALVLDLRGNGGGSTPWRLRKALTGGRGRRWRVQHDNARPSLLLRMAAPVVIRAARVPRFRGRIVVLTDGGCYSACEDLTGALRGLRHVTVVGDTTGGSTGQPIVTSFGNGMNARVSARRYLLPDGAPFEGAGIAPDVAVPWTVASLRDGSDPALERAAALASGVAR